MFEYYSQALELKKKHTTSYYVTVSSMAEALIELNQHEKAAVRLKQN